MSGHDFLGNAIAIDDPEVIGSWNEVIRAVLAHAATAPTALQAVLDRAPNFALAQAARGLMMMTLARREMVALARTCYDTAKRHASDPREQGYVKALGSWIAGDPLRASDDLDAVAAAYPSDVLAVKLAHQIRFMAGDAAGMLSSIERQAGAFTGTSVEASILGCKAFALEERGQYDAAEAVGREALALDECDAWARHAVAHVLEMNGRAAEGAAWLGASAERWKHTNNFGLHLYWHQALFLLELGRRDEVLGLYDQFIRAKPSDDFRDIANASALLARLEFEGVSVGGRWDELGEAAARRIDDRALVFADLHYALALAGAGRSADAERLGASLIVRGAEGDRYDDSVAQSVGISVAEAITAFRRGDHAMAAKLMWAVRAKMPTIGGSNAQRDLFEQLLIESLMRAGDYDRAETVLRRRLGERGGRNAFAANRLRRLADPAGIRYRLGRLITASMPLAAVH